jgi:phage-related protein
MGAYFIYNGISSKDMGVILKKLPPITKPKKRIEIVQVPGRNGTLHIDENCYEPINISLECTLKKNINVRDITKWLIEFGTITFSDELDKYYNATITNSIPLERVFRLYREFIIQLELQPIAQSTQEYVYNCNNTNENTLKIDSSAEMYPYIKLTGTGEVKLTINNKICTVTIDDEYIELDSELQNAYKGVKNKNDKMNGEFPILIPGNNKIQITGNATMQIKYRKAYI